MNNLINKSIASAGRRPYPFSFSPRQVISLPRPLRRTLVALLSLSLCFPGLSSGQAIGIKNSDTTPPRIKHVPETEFTAGMPIRILATVTDDVGVDNVILLYRTAGDIPYQQVNMVEAPIHDIYAADLPETAGPRIEYLIQAVDEAGNTAMTDQSGKPYEITVPTMTAVADDIVTAPAAEPEPEPIVVAKKGSGTKWLWIGFGVLAAGVLASAGSGGGSSAPAPTTGSGNTGGGGTTVGTGTVSITAALPAP